MRAIAAVAGVAVYRPTVDEDSIDIGFASRTTERGSLTLQSPRLEAQLECTSTPMDPKGGATIRLADRNYEDLRRLVHVPRIVVVVVVPSDVEAWMRWDEQHLQLRCSAWWTSLRNAQPINAASTTVRATRRLDAPTLVELLRGVAMWRTP